MPIHQSYSSRETIRIGRDFAENILRRGPGGRAVVIVLCGKIGAGKTTFTKGLYKGFGTGARVMSPTFIIMRRTPIRGGAFRNIFHIDCYRINSKSDLRGMGFSEIFKNPENIVVIEWPERISRIIPRGSWVVTLVHGKKENERKITHYK